MQCIDPYYILKHIDIYAYIYSCTYIHIWLLQVYVKYATSLFLAFDLNITCVTESVYKCEWWDWCASANISTVYGIFNKLQNIYWDIDIHRDRTLTHTHTHMCDIEKYTSPPLIYSNYTHHHQHHHRTNITKYTKYTRRASRTVYKTTIVQLFQISMGIKMNEWMETVCIQIRRISIANWRKQNKNRIKTFSYLK